MKISTFTFSNATGPYAPSQTDGGVTAHNFAISGSGATFDGTYLRLPAGTYLTAGMAGISLPTNTDPAKTQTPEEFTLEYTGILPADESPLVSLFDYGDGRIDLYSHWDTGRLRANFERNGTTAMIDSIAGLSTTAEERVGLRYVDNPSGAGGTVTFLRNGAAFGPSQTIAFKPRITPDSTLECNASLANTSNSRAQKVREIKLSLGAQTTTNPPGGGNGKSSTFGFPNAAGPYAPVQANGGVTTQGFSISGSGATFNGTYLQLPAGTYLTAGNAGITLPTNTDPAKTQTPEEITLEYVGILPATNSPLVSLYDYNDGEISLYAHWDTGRLRANFERNGTRAQIDSIGGLSMTAEERVGLRYVDNPSGAGGTITFLRNGVALGTSQTLAFKPRITPDAMLECNASLGNTANSGAQKVREIKLTLGTQGTNPPGGGGGTFTVYGKPGTRFPLDIPVSGSAATYAVTIPSGLAVQERVASDVLVDRTSTYGFPNTGPNFAPTQTNEGITSNSLSMVGSGATFDGTYLRLPAGTYLTAGALGISLPTSSDPAKTQTPVAIELEFTGILPANQSPLVSLFGYSTGEFSLNSHWDTGRLRLTMQRDAQSIQIDSIGGLSTTAQEKLGVRYDDNPTGAGGTITFLRNGAAFGPSQAVAFKPRIAPDAELEHNASLGNTSNSVAQKIANIAVKIKTAGQSYAFQPVTSGTISAARLEALYVDATGVSAPQAAKTISATPAGGTAFTVDVIVGPVAVAAGQAYRAVLENWSSGSRVDHPQALVMTRPARQNCQFEDSFLRANQTPWMECLPEGPVPTIGGIAYYCEATRSGSYVQFQFGYDWTTAVMPDNPFGDPTGKDSYMVPHKWRIEDQAGNVLSTVQRPDGGPLNGTDIPRIFSGSYDGNGAAITNATNKWYPHGTVRSGVIWRSGTPAAYDQLAINANLPRYDASVPYGSHTHFSSNGFDVRLFGSDGFNGFGNTRVMPYQPTNHATLVPQAGVTNDPYKGSLYTASSLAAVASTWLRYTPFNQCGRSPITGPGGVRDDRCAIAEPVAAYMYDVASLRPHDGTARAQIAIDYLTAYASDPFHCFEGGRNVPLFKGANAARDIGMRGHYYGYGSGSRPANRSYYVQGGRQYDMADSYDPWSTKVPYGGVAADKPYFGTNEIDLPHAHQFPHWGSLLWKSPEFAFLGHKLSDQARLYENWILSGPFGEPNLFAERGAAWQFLHAALIWKTASRNSDRLYSRDEILAFVVQDFEAFSAAHKTSNPGFDNPPTNVMVGGSIDDARAIYAATHRFGVCGLHDDDIAQHDFYIGYWLTALGIAERIGFNAAVRARSATAGAVLDWLIAKHRQRIVGRINVAANTDCGTGSPYLLRIWSRASLTAAGGNVASLPQGYANLAAVNGTNASWDVFKEGGSVGTRDGQAMDQLIAGPSILKTQLGQSGTDLDQSATTAASWRSQKITQQNLLGPNGAGTTWFRYLQIVHNPVIS